ncbi:chorismate mutase [Cladochytrium replicatum]|nr:chorismate mutase [Cladochytrium replicatum]
MNFFANGDSPLSLDIIRNELVRLEDSIVFALIERAQFSHNKCIYTKNHFNFENFDGSFLDYFLFDIEKAHAKVRRYTSPDEFPFCKDLPAPVLPPLDFPKILDPLSTFNINDEILSIYINEIVPSITRPDTDDLNYGSSATKDVEALQLLSRRIHFGKFVAEAKFVDPNYHDKYVELIRKKDVDGIEELLTNKAVEERVLRRLRAKALTYGAEIDDSGAPTPAKEPRISPDSLVNLYERFVIPLTKKVEVRYLLERLHEDDSWRGSKRKHDE